MICLVLLAINSYAVFIVLRGYVGRNDFSSYPKLDRTEFLELMRNLKFHESIVVGMEHHDDPLSVRQRWMTHVHQLLKFGLSQDLSSVQNLCSMKFVELPKTRCNSQFGNGLHEYTNSIVAASALGRKILFSGGPDCKYFDRPDQINNDTNFLNKRNKLCPDNKLSPGRSFKYWPPENAWPLRCNRTFEEFRTIDLLRFTALQHHNAAALFQNPMIQNNLELLSIPTNFDEETDFLRRYEIFGIIFKFLFPFRHEVTNYYISPSPNEFTMVLGLHLRHFKHLGLNVEKTDEISCTRLKNLFKTIVTAKKCAWLIGTEHTDSENRLKKCAVDIGCTPLSRNFRDRRLGRQHKDHGDLGKLAGLSVMHALPLYSTHLVTSEGSSFSKLIAELWVANKGVSAALGKWWVLPKSPVNITIPRPHKFNFEFWEIGHSKDSLVKKC